MKAVICTKYGPPDVLQVRDVAQPTPRDNEVLLKIRATAVTASDCIVRGFKLPRGSVQGLAMGLALGFRGPRKPILGMVVAGDVAEVGRSVTRFKPGDPVYGSTLSTGTAVRFGAYAEYICLPEDSLIVTKPPNLSYEEAAALPYGFGLAVCFLKKGDIESRRKVLIYGASGAIGTAAVQVAKAYGAEVTGVCSTRNLDLVRSLGADRVLDYTTQATPDKGELYDLVFDAVGESKTSPLKDACRQAPAPGGRYLSVDNGSPRNQLADYLLLNELVAAGKMRAVIDRGYPLAQIAEAHRYVDEGHKQGNVVITVAETVG